MAKLAYSIAELEEQGGPARTKAYEDIRSGALVARKLGSRTVVLHDDFVQYLEDLPKAEPEGAKR